MAFEKTSGTVDRPINLIWGDISHFFWFHHKLVLMLKIQISHMVKWVKLFAEFS